MFNSRIKIDEIVSFAIMLLMTAALVSDQVGAKERLADRIQTIDSKVIIEGPLGDELKQDLRAVALKLGVAIASDLTHFRGEDD